MRNELNLMPAPATHRYYVGDLCYVLTRDEWNRVCSSMDFGVDQNTYNDPDGYDCEGSLDPELFDYDNPGAERPYYIFGTAYGDGQYNDKEGQSYSVDSGTLGAIRVDYISDEKLLEQTVSKGLGHVHEFDSEFSSGSCFYDNGLIGFDTVEIATAGNDEDEEEDEFDSENDKD